MATANSTMFQASDLNQHNERVQRRYRLLFGLMTLLLITPVLLILGTLVAKGGGAISWEFLFSAPTNGMRTGGVFPALLGTIWLVTVALLLSVPIGIFAAIYLSEYAGDNWFTRAINLAIINLAGVPSIVHALFGLGAFVLFFKFGTSILAASLTLAVMTMPVVIVATRESLQAVPQAFREACWNMGATRWQTIRRVVLPELAHRHPDRCHSRSIAHGRRDGADHVHRRRLLHALPAAKRLRPDDGPVPAPLRHGNAGTGNRRRGPLCRRAGADRSRADDEQRLDCLPDVVEGEKEMVDVAAPAPATDASQQAVAAVPNKLEVRDLTIRYGSAVALRDVSLSIREHEIFGIIGPANAGKTSFLKAVNRMDEFTTGMRVDGEIRFNGRDTRRLSNVYALRSRIGVVFPLPVGLPMTVYDNVALSPRLRGIKEKAELDVIVQRCLTRAALWDEVKDRLNALGSLLSGGQQQRLTIARALSQEPDLLMLDEFSIAVDPVTTMRIEDVLKELRQEVTIILVTNLVQQARRLADRTAFFLGGECVEIGVTEDLFTGEVKDQRTRDYVEGRFG